MTWMAVGEPASTEATEAAGAPEVAEPFNFGDWFWETLQGLATIAPLGTFAAAVIAGVALWQKAKSDRRQAWWERLKWATDTALSKDPQANRVGIEAVKAVQQVRRVHPDDQLLLEAVGTEFQRDEVVDLLVLGDSSVPLDGDAYASDNDVEERGDGHA